MENLELYNKVRAVPSEAQKPIIGGRLKGMTDINPMWRIKTLTECFGQCGVGWYFQPTEEKIERFEGTNEAIAIVRGNLFYKQDGEWSMPVFGEGGAKIVSSERSGLYVDDEAFKKASTDAISVACKSLGIAADVYWEKDTDKYSPLPTSDNKASNKPASTADSKASTDAEECRKMRAQIIKYASEHGMTAHEVAKDYALNDSTPLDRLKEVWADLNSGGQSTEPQEEMPENFEAIDEEVPWR